MTIEAKDIQDIVKALSEAVEHKSAWVEVIKLLVWPAVVVFGFIMFRTPLSHFLGDLGRRLTKLSAFHVEIELSAVATPSVSLADFIVFPEDNLTGGDFMPTTVMELLRRITEAPRSDYLIVDIGDGRRWLTSRLYLFSFMLWRIGVVRCVAFVETSGAYRKRLLGLAEPAMVCAALGTRYPWFDKALVQASSLKGDELSLTAVPLPREQAQKMVDRMISNPLIRQPEIPEAPEEWELFKPGED